jgi:hypothetical protein
MAREEKLMNDRSKDYRGRHTQWLSKANIVLESNRVWHSLGHELVHALQSTVNEHRQLKKRSDKSGTSTLTVTPTVFNICSLCAGVGPR